MSKSSSKRPANQQRRRQPQPEEGDEQYDEYVYYPYYPKTASGGGYEYIPEDEEHDQPAGERYYEETTDSAPIQRT